MLIILFAHLYGLKIQKACQTKAKNLKFYSTNA